MSPFLIGFFAAAGAAAWIYSKAMRQTGGNTKNAGTIAVVGGIIAYILIVTILSLIDSALEN